MNKSIDIKKKIVKLPRQIQYFDFLEPDEFFDAQLKAWQPLWYQGW